MKPVLRLMGPMCNRSQIISFRLFFRRIFDKTDNNADNKEYTGVDTAPASIQEVWITLGVELEIKAFLPERKF